MKFDIEDVMKFNIKNIKSWSNRKDVKIGAEGYFFNKISDLRNIEHIGYSRIEHINDNQANCFFSTAFYGGYSFFLPLNAVKEDKTKNNKYRPFKNLYEFYQFLSFNSHITEEEFTPVMLLGLYFKYRDKGAPWLTHTIVINRIDFDLANDPCKPSVEGRNLELWFANYEIMNDEDKWQPFGVEKK